MSATQLGRHKRDADSLSNQDGADRTVTVLSLGVVDRRNIWKTDLNAVLDWNRWLNDWATGSRSRRPARRCMSWSTWPASARWTPESDRGWLLRCKNSMS
jgi:Cobalamin-independent synthase, N-terminal domain